MPFMNNGVFFMILFCWHFMLGVVARGIAPIFYEIAPLRMALKAMESWILPAGSVALAEGGITTLKYLSRYRKLPLFSPLVLCDGRNRERRKEKWKP